VALPRRARYLQRVHRAVAVKEPEGLKIPGGRVPGRSRPAWWTQLAVIVVGLWLYDRINNLSPLRASQALGHGAAVLHLEGRLHLDPELTLNHWLGHHVSLARFLADYYDLAHFAVTLVLLAWVWWRRPVVYRFLRDALAGINAIGLAVFWLYPVAPPRMLASSGFVDTVAVTHALGAWSSGALASQANEFAAMPSLHVAYAVWCAIAVWHITGKRWLRGLSVGYALLTSWVVVATANHYFLDVVAGATTAGVSGALAWAWERRRRPQAVRPSRVDVAT
jgi:hypothetical protein